MVVYNCPRCGYNTKYRSHIKNHLNRKNLCEPLIEDMEIEEIKFMYNLCEDPKITQKNPKITHFEPKITQNNPILKPMIKKFECLYCEKEFKRNWHLERHLKCCKIKKSIDILQEKKQILNTINNNTTNNNTTNNKILNNNTNTNCHNTNSNNITQNITINNYGEENLKCLTEEYLTKLIKGAFTAIPKLIEKIHFNPEYPENQNIKITNKKEPYIKVRKNNQWELQDKKETIDTIVDDKYYILDDHIDTQTELTEFETEIMEKFKERVNNDEDLLKEIKKKTELIILNKSKQK
tara:strand:+ start:105 stop:986 length:882 start_codon:yes stop_codon:yes gene_type:complete